MERRELGHYLRQLGRAAEEAFVDYRKGDYAITDLFKRVFDSSAPKYDRVNALFRLTREVIPLDLESSLRNLFRSADELPFNPETYEFSEKIGSGGESDVYLMESKVNSKPSLALKVIHCKRGGVKIVEEYAKKIRSEYERFKEIYKEIPELIPEERVLILRDPRRLVKKINQPAVAVLQGFIGGDIRDAFLEISREEFVSLLKDDKNFNKQFHDFLCITIEHEKATGEIADLLGPKNLSVVQREKGPALVFLDPHVIYSINSDQGQTTEKLKKSLSYLSGIAQETEFSKTPSQTA